MLFVCLKYIFGISYDARKYTNIKYFKICVILYTLLDKIEYMTRWIFELFLLKLVK